MKRENIIAHIFSPFFLLSSRPETRHQASATRALWSVRPQYRDRNSLRRSGQLLNTTPRCSSSETKTRKHKDRHEIWLDIFKQFFCQLEILKRLYHEGHVYFTNHLFACIYLVQSHSHTTLLFNLCERQCPCWFLFTLIVSLSSFPWYCLFFHVLWKLVLHNKDTRTTWADGRELGNLFGLPGMKKCRM
jgi:hypothetical protein